MTTSLSSYWPSKSISYLTVVFLLLAISASKIKAQIYPDNPVGFVNDIVGIFEPGEAQRLEAKLNAYRDSTSNVIVITTLESLQGSSIEEVATSMFSDWRMWEGDRRNGVLILVVPSERRIRIEVGYGLEGAIPDILAGRVISNIIQPAFREGRFYDGINRATSALMQMAAGEYEAVPQKSSRPKGNNGSMVLLFIIAVIVYMAVENRGRKFNDNDDDNDYKGRGKEGRNKHISYGDWDNVPRRRGGGIVIGGGFGGGGFGGGGFGGFGGGGGFGSGGGGASGGW